VQPCCFNHSRTPGKAPEEAALRDSEEEEEEEGLYKIVFID